MALTERDVGQKIKHKDGAKAVLESFHYFGKITIIYYFDDASLGAWSEEASDDGWSLDN